MEINIVRTLQRERRQYDVIACRAGRTVLVECKRWSVHRPRLTALKRVIDGPQAIFWHINEYASALIYCCGKGGAGCCLISLIDPLSEWAC